jgi:hypothetical protein
MADDSSALVAFLSEVLCSLTPLLAPPLITWGALALQAVNVGHASFVLALSNHFIVKASIFTPSNLVIGNMELKIIAFTSLILPSFVHLAVHYHMMLGGPSTSALAAFLAIKEGSLDQARTDVLWELIILTSGGIVNLLHLDGVARLRKRSVIGSLPASLQSVNHQLGGSSGDEVTVSSWFLSWTQLHNMPMLMSVTLFLYAIETRLLVFIRQYLDVWWGGFGLFVAATLIVAGFSLWVHVEDEEKSVVFLHALTSAAMFIITHVFGKSFFFCVFGISTN